MQNAVVGDTLYLVDWASNEKNDFIGMPWFLERYAAYTGNRPRMVVDDISAAPWREG
jgi:hypothetical protein